MFTFCMFRTCIIDFWFVVLKSINLRGSFWLTITTDPVLLFKQEASPLRVMFTFFFKIRTIVTEFWFELIKCSNLRGFFRSAITTDPVLLLKQDVSALRFILHVITSIRSLMCVLKSILGFYVPLWSLCFLIFVFRPKNIDQLTII